MSEEPLLSLLWPQTGHLKETSISFLEEGLFHGHFYVGHLMYSRQRPRL